MIAFSVFLLIIFDQSNAEVFVDETDLQLICNATRLLVATNLEPVSIVEKISDVLERVSGLHSMKDIQDPMTSNIERMMITSLVMEFVPDIVHWKSTYRQQCEPSRENPVPEALTYKIDITNKGKAKSGITSLFNAVAVQRGVINNFGKSYVREAVSKNKFKKSDVETKFSSIDVNTAGVRDVQGTLPQIGSAIQTFISQIQAVLDGFTRAFNSEETRDQVWKMMENSSVLAATLELDPIAGACRSMKISVPLNSTDPNTWWQGIDSVRGALATANIGLIYTRQGDTCR